MILNKPQSRVMRVLAEVQRDLTLAIAFSRGVGKSWFIRRVAYYLVAKWDGVEREADGKTITGVRIIFLMPTFKQFRDIHTRELMKELSGEFAALGARVNRSTFTVEFPGGSWIQVFPASDHGSKRALGMRCDVVLLDEADDIERGVYEVVVAPWFTEPWTLNIRIGSGTPRRGRHGLLYKLFSSGNLGARVRAGERLAIDEMEAEAYRTHYAFHATYRDAPGNVSEQAAAAARVTMTPAAFKREWECDFDAGEGLVYGSTFEEPTHVQPPPEGVAWSEILIGCDHGYEDPGVFLLIGVLGSGRDAVAWVLAEVYAQHKTEDWWKKRLLEWLADYPAARFYGDPSMPARIEAFKRDCRARVQEVDNSIEDGVAAVADRFIVREHLDETGAVARRTARLYISPQCRGLIRELGLYKRKADPQDPDRYLDDIVDRDNHGPDALRYAIFNRFGGPDRRRKGSPHEALG